MTTRVGHSQQRGPRDVLTLVAAIAPPAEIDELWDPRDQAAVRNRIIKGLQPVDAGDHDTASTRFRRPSRKVAIRTGIALLATAAAVSAVTMVTGSNEAPPTSTRAPQPNAIELIDFNLPTLSLILPEPPPGAGDPAFGASSDGSTATSYASTENPLDNLTIMVGSEPLAPDGPVTFPGSVLEDVAIDGRPAVVVAPTDSEEEVAGLSWERQPGQWVSIVAQGRYAQRDLLIDIAGDLVDGVRTIPLQLHLAPAGYSFDFSKDNGRIVRLGDHTDVNSGLVVRLLSPQEVAADVDVPGVGGLATGAVEQVTAQGQPAQLARTDDGDGGPGGWVLQARLPNGSTFVVEASGELTVEQMVQIADQVTYTP